MLLDHGRFAFWNHRELTTCRLEYNIIACSVLLLLLSKCAIDVTWGIEDTKYVFLLLSKCSAYLFARWSLSAYPVFLSYRGLQWLTDCAEKRICAARKIE